VRRELLTILSQYDIAQISKIGDKMSIKKVSDKKVMFKKPNQLIMTTHGEISVTQKKAYNILLYKALQDLRINPNQIVFSVSAHEIKEMAGIKATDNWHLKNDLEALMNIKVSCVREKGDGWASFVLLSYFDKKDDVLQFEVPNIIREALIKGDYFTTLDLMILKSFHRKYALILYELALRYNKVEIPKLKIDEFKKLTGTESYDNFNDLKRFCIDPGIEEINDKSDILMWYELFQLGRKVVEIKFYLKKKAHMFLEDSPENQPSADPHPTPVSNQPASVSDRINLNTMIPPEHRTKKSVQFLIDQYFKKFGFGYIKRNILYANLNATQNYHSFLAKSLKEDWGLSDYENSEQALKFSFDLKPGMKIQFQNNVVDRWRGKVFTIEEGVCIHPDGWDGGCYPEGDIRKGIREGYIKIIG